MLILFWDIFWLNFLLTSSEKSISNIVDTLIKRCFQINIGFMRQNIPTYLNLFISVLSSLYLSIFTDVYHFTISVFCSNNPIIYNIFFFFHSKLRNDTSILMRIYFSLYFSLAIFDEIIRENDNLKFPRQFCSALFKNWLTRTKEMSNKILLLNLVEYVHIISQIK